MVRNPEQRSLPVTAEKRVPVTSAQCLFNATLSSAYVCGLAYLTMHWSLGFGIFLLLHLDAVWRSIRALRHLRRGDRVESVFTPRQKRDHPALLVCEYVCMTVAAVALTTFTLFMLYPFQPPPSFARGSLFLLLNLGMWRGVYHTFTQDRTYGANPKIKVTAMNKAKAPVAAAANVTEHWWADTPLREENKVMAGRQ